MKITDLELDLLGDVGTLAWAQRGDGLLTTGERRRCLAAAVAESARSMPRLLALKFGKTGNKRASITAHDLLLPEVAPAASIIAECRPPHDGVGCRAQLSFLRLREGVGPDGRDCP